MLKIEKKMVDWFKNNYLIIGLIIVTILACLVRYYMLDFESGDYVSCLSPWFDYLRDNGGILALKNHPGDYNVPYMMIMTLLTYIPLNKLYLIKIVSIIFDFCLALSSAYLVCYLVRDNKKIYFLFTYAIMLFIPEVLMNSAIWGQCDSIYTTFIVLSLLFLLKEKYGCSFILLGVAFAFKLQFIFILPLYIIIYFASKKFSIINFLYIPLVNLILSTPAIVAGRSIGKILSVYFDQVEAYSDSLSWNFLNIYELIGINATIMCKYGIIVIIIICLMMLIYTIYKKVKFDNEKILNLGLWFIIVTTFLLPRMHDRYLYVGSVLALINYIVYRKNLLLLISVNVCSIITYSEFLFGTSMNLRSTIVIAYVVVIAYYTKDTLRELVKTN